MNRWQFTNELDKARKLLDEARLILDNIEYKSDEMDSLETACEPLQDIIDTIDSILLLEEEREDEDEEADAEET